MSGFCLVETFQQCIYDSILCLYRYVFTIHIIVHHLSVWTSFCVYGRTKCINFVWCLFKVFIMIHILYAMHVHKERWISINVVNVVKILIFNSNFIFISLQLFLSNFYHFSIQVKLDPFWWVLKLAVYYKKNLCRKNPRNLQM